VGAVVTPRRLDETPDPMGGFGSRCPMCGGAQHKTKAAVLACSGARRAEFRELRSLAQQIGKPKKETT
jgi:hypothetical protein